MIIAVLALVDLLNQLVLGYFLALNAGYLLSSLAAFRALRRYTRRLRALDLSDLLASAGMPPITLVAPAYNEEATWVDAIRSLLMLSYAEFEAIVVNDGSRDDTLGRYLAFLVTVVAGRASGAYVLGFLTLAFVLGIVLSVAAVALEELSFHRYPKTRDLASLIWLGVVENFGYRQLAILWRMGGTLSALRRKQGWGRMERQGFGAPARGVT